jgi:hypothetical protein
MHLSEDSRHVACEPMLFGEWVLTFKMLWHLFLHDQAVVLGCLTMQIKVLQSLQMSGSTHQMTHVIPEDWNPEEHFCEKPKSVRHSSLYHDVHTSWNQHGLPFKVWPSLTFKAAGPQSRLLLLELECRMCANFSFMPPVHIHVVLHGHRSSFTVGTCQLSITSA